MVFAQVEFLFLILTGIVLMGLSAFLMAMPASNVACNMWLWFGNIGFTLEIVPLCTKMSAINRLMQASRSMKKRFVLRKRSLYGTVTGITAAVGLYLTLWMLLDPRRKLDVFELSTEVGNGETVIIQQSYCASNNAFWRYINLIWYCILLLCATVLAFQTRGHRQEFNESKTLAVLIYSHSVFLVLRVITVFFLSALVDKSTEWLCQSIIISADVTAALVVYFVPKFFTSDEEHRRKSLTGSSWTKRLSYLEKNGETPNDDATSDARQECSICRNDSTSNGQALCDGNCVRGRLARDLSHSLLLGSSDSPPIMQLSSSDEDEASSVEEDGTARRRGDTIDDNEGVAEDIRHPDSNDQL
jgi:hypothetical protein